MVVKLTDREIQRLEHVKKGFVTVDRVMRDTVLHDLAIDGLIDTHNFGHFRPTVFLTEKGDLALAQAKRGEEV